jgi:hypothetical protein
MGIIDWSYKTAEPKLTQIAMVKIVMLMGKFRAGIIGMVTFFLRKFFLQMPNTVDGLKHYCKQYCNNQRNI